MPVKVHHYEQLSSTNTTAKKMAETGPSNWTVITADAQTEGRGRFNRKWESGRKLGLWFSIILFPDFPEKFYNSLNLSTALIISDFLSNETYRKFNRILSEIKLKWPNDIYINGRKVCGILIEGSSNKQGKRFLVIGIGLNVNHLPQDFSKEITDSSISLRMVTNTIWDLKELQENFLEYYYVNLNKAIKNNFVNLHHRYQTKMMLLNQKIRVHINSTLIEGYVKGINSEGLLRLDLGDKEQLIITSDIWNLSEE